MKPLRTIALVSAAFLALLPGAAHAAPEDGMGCPQGYVVFDAQRGQGGPPSYLPGETVTASGYLTDAKAKAAPSVTLRWGSPEGAAVGQAAIDSEGSWKGLKFAIPEGTPHQTYDLYLEARDANGQMLPGLPIPTQLRVGPPLVTPSAGDRKPATTRPITTVKPLERAARPERIVRVKSIARPQAPARPEVAVRPERAPAETSATTERRTVERSKAARPAAEQPQRRAASKQKLGAPAVGRQAPDPPRSAGAEPASVSTQSAEDRTAWAVGAAVLLGILTLIGMFLRRRGVPALKTSPPPALDPSRTGASMPDAQEQAADLLIEAELQEMIAEQRAREVTEPAPEPTRAGR